MSEKGEVSEWQPIETAPVNEFVLVFFTRDHTMEVARRLISPDGEDLGWWANDGLDFYGADTPSHWMPLPAPPHREERPR